jgi:hypothetical protein
MEALAATATLVMVEPTAITGNEETADTETAEIAEAMAVPPTAAPVAESGSLVISGRLEEGAFFRGDTNAPVTLIDYSDFL